MTDIRKCLRSNAYCAIAAAAHKRAPEGDLLMRALLEIGGQRIYDALRALVDDTARARVHYPQIRVTAFAAAPATSLVITDADIHATVEALAEAHVIRCYNYGEEWFYELLEDWEQPRHRPAASTVPAPGGVALPPEGTQTQPRHRIKPDIAGALTTIELTLSPSALSAWRAFTSMAAAQRKDGRIAESVLVAMLQEILKRITAEGMSDDALIAGLTSATRAQADNTNYVIKVARSYMRKGYADDVPAGASVPPAKAKGVKVGGHTEVSVDPAKKALPPKRRAQ